MVLIENIPNWARICVCECSSYPATTLNAKPEQIWLLSPSLICGQSSVVTTVCQ